jgi:hypothetical protein
LLAPEKIFATVVETDMAMIPEPPPAASDDKAAARLHSAVKDRSQKNAVRLHVHEHGISAARRSGSRSCRRFASASSGT